MLQRDVLVVDDRLRSDKQLAPTLQNILLGIVTWVRASPREQQVPRAYLLGNFQRLFEGYSSQVLKAIRILCDADLLDQARDSVPRLLAFGVPTDAWPSVLRCDDKGQPYTLGLHIPNDAEYNEWLDRLRSANRHHPEPFPTEIVRAPPATPFINNPKPSLEDRIGDRVASSSRQATPAKLSKQPAAPGSKERRPTSFRGSDTDVVLTGQNMVRLLPAVIAFGAK